jgi:hypothetical protein
MTDRLPPHDLDAEMSVLGAMLYDKDALKIGLDKLTSEDFYKDSHRIIFGALRDTGAADPLAVAANIKSKGYSEPDKSDLHACLENCLGPRQIDIHAEMVLDLSRRRADIATMHRAITAAYQGDDYQEILHEGPSEVSRGPVGFTAMELLAMDLPEPAWTIPGILPQGFGLLCGKPKDGKSMLTLNAGLGVAHGGQVLGQKVEYGEVLALCLEDSPRRLQSRITTMLQGDAPPASLNLMVEWPRLDNGGIEHLDNWITQHPDCRLVIVDTLARVRERMKGNGHLYYDDYQAVGPLKALADAYDIAILAVHHLRKSESSVDLLDDVSGSTGLTGAADAVLLLKRSRGRSDAELTIIGRDLEDTELAVDFDATTATWILKGPAAEYRESCERAAILEVVRQAGESIGPKAIAEAVDKNENTIKTLVSRMVKAGTLEKHGRGLYTLPTHIEVKSEPL